MSSTEGLMVKVNGSPELVGELERVVGENSDAMTLQSVGPSQEASNLKLGLGEVATIVAILKGVIDIGKFAFSIYQYLAKRKSERITVQTPLRTVEIHGSDATSEARVLELLEGAVRV